MLSALTFVAAASASAAIAIAPQYDSTHVYVAAPDFDRFVAAFTATFGGKTSAKGSATVTPTPSKTFSQLIITPAGTVSVFGYQTPIPYPFGLERTGYLVRDMDAAVTAARGDGAAVVVAPFDDPIGRDAIVEWPGGVDMQLYWHTVPPRYDPLETIPENRVYVSPDAADAFIHDFSEFSKGTFTEDDASANGSEIGRPGYTYRRIKFQSVFGKMTVFVTDGHLPYPYGRETTGYEVQDLAATLKKAGLRKFGWAGERYFCLRRNSSPCATPNFSRNSFELRIPGTLPSPSSIVSASGSMFALNGAALADARSAASNAPSTITASAPGEISISVAISSSCTRSCHALTAPSME